MNFSTLFDKIKNKSIIKKIVCILLAIFVVIIFVINTIKQDNNSNSSNETLYSTQLETKLNEVLSKVKGVGKVYTMITVESGMETVIAMKKTQTTTQSGTEIVETPVLVNGKTVTLREDYPKINGVVIVCEGANNISVISKIQQATMSLFNIEKNQIEILSMN